MSKNVVCTISREGTTATNNMLMASLDRLQELDYYLMGVHIGARNTNLSSRFREIHDHLIEESEPNIKNPIRKARLLSEKIFHGLRYLMNVARETNAEAILYTEADKFTFIPHIPKIILPITSGNADVVLATRSPEGFAEFPVVQRVIETIVNKYISTRVGVKADFEYGPRAFSKRATTLFNEYPYNDWGAQMYPVVAAIKKGYSISLVEVPGKPQPRYMEKYDPLARTIPGQIIWRTIQNTSIIKATDLALK